MKNFSMQSISKKNLPYIFGWIIMFIWLYSYFLPFGGFCFESNLYNYKAGETPVYTYVWLLTCPLITFIFDGRKMVSKTFYSILIASVCFIALRFTYAGPVSIIIMILASICIGHIFASSCYTFFMILNNSEKFYSMIFAVTIPKFLLFLKPYLNHPEEKLDQSTILVAVLLTIFAVCAWLYRKNHDELQNVPNQQAPPKAYSLMVIVFIVLMLNDVIAPAILQSLESTPPHQRESLHFYGVLAGVILILLLQNRFSANIFILINFSFALIAIGFVFSILHNQTRSTGLISAFCFGMSYSVAMVNIYYLAGFMAKKFQSMKFYRTGIALSSVYYFTAISIIVTSEKTRIFNSREFMSIFSLGVVILFLMLSPMFIKMLNNGDWIDDTYRTDVTNMSRLEARLKELKLTPAEIEVCTLLLEGYTLRQISGIVGKAYSTVNTYYVSIYKKLNINSRAELLITFQDYMK